jgi:hypothetical protein
MILLHAVSSPRAEAMNTPFLSRNTGKNSFTDCLATQRRRASLTKYFMFDAFRVKT